MGIKTKRNFLQWFRFWLVLPGIQRQKENLCRRNQVTQWTRGSDLINSSLKLKGGQSFSSRDPSPSEPARSQSQSQGCHAGSMRHRLSRLLAAATSVLTLLSPPSNWARLWRRVMMAVTAFWTSDTSCWESMFSGWPAGDSGTDVSSWVFLCHAMISSRSTAFRTPSTWDRAERRVRTSERSNRNPCSDHAVTVRTFWLLNPNRVGCQED